MLYSARFLFSKALECVRLHCIFISDLTDCTVLHQPDSVITAKPGDNVNLRCFFAKNYSIYSMFWYKQTKGQQPCGVVKVGTINNPVFYKKYENTRFSVSKLTERFSLSIKNISQWDEAIYFCGIEIFFDIEFGNGVFLTLNGSSANSTNNSKLFLTCNILNN